MVCFVCSYCRWELADTKHAKHVNPRHMHTLFCFMIFFLHCHLFHMGVSADANAHSLSILILISKCILILILTLILISILKYYVGGYQPTRGTPIQDTCTPLSNSNFLFLFLFFHFFFFFCSFFPLVYVGICRREARQSTTHAHPFQIQIAFSCFFFFFLFSSLLFFLFFCRWVSADAKRANPRHIHTLFIFRFSSSFSFSLSFSISFSFFS